MAIPWQTSTQEQTEEKAVTTPEASKKEEKSQTGRSDNKDFFVPFLNKRNSFSFPVFASAPLRQKSTKQKQEKVKAVNSPEACEQEEKSQTCKDKTKKRYILFLGKSLFFHCFWCL